MNFFESNGEVGLLDPSASSNPENLLLLLVVVVNPVNRKNAEDLQELGSRFLQEDIRQNLLCGFCMGLERLPSIIPKIKLEKIPEPQAPAHSRRPGA
jgi:hypothetical protein